MNIQISWIVSRTLKTRHLMRELRPLQPPQLSPRRRNGSLVALRKARTSGRRLTNGLRLENYSGETPGELQGGKRTSAAYVSHELIIDVFQLDIFWKPCTKTSRNISLMLYKTHSWLTSKSPTYSTPMLLVRPMLPTHTVNSVGWRTF